MHSPTVQVPRRRTGLILAIALTPVVLTILIVGILFALHAAHQDGRWTAVTKRCPTLDAAAATALGVGASPLPDNSARVAFDSDTRRNCFYSPGGDTNDSMQVTVILYEGGLTHSSHGEAVAAMRDNPPPAFRAIGDQNEESQHFGMRGSGSAHLSLINVVDNAQVRIDYYNVGKLRDATETQAAALRAPLQVVSDQAIANLG